MERVPAQDWSSRCIIGCRSPSLPPGLRSNLILPTGSSGSARSRAETLVRLTLGDGCTVSEEHFLEHRLGRLRDVRIDPSGVLYVLTDGPEGMLYRLNRGTGEEDKEKTHL